MQKFNKLSILLLGFIFAIVLQSCSTSRFTTFNRSTTLNAEKAICIHNNTNVSRQITPQETTVQPISIPQSEKENTKVVHASKISLPAHGAVSPVVSKLSRLVYTPLKITANKALRKMLRNEQPTVSTMAENAMAIVGFVCGLLSFLLIWFPYVDIIGIIAAIAGLILSIIGLSGDVNKGFAIAGLILSILTLLIFILVIIIVASML
jgi:hypothetical protein